MNTAVSDLRDLGCAYWYHCLVVWQDSLFEDLVL